VSIDVRKKENESNEGVIRRFTRKVQTSGMIPLIKDNQFHRPKKNKTQIRRDAQRRSGIRQTIEYLRKIGKLTEDLDRTKAKKLIIRPKVKK